jgi:nitrogenase molybdenum-iron protein beta chain
MSHHLEGSRNSCALHGSLQVFEAIEGTVPVIHSTSGCGVQHYLGVTRLSGGNDPVGAAPVSSSNISEKHVVFGGGSRLREQLKNTVKVVQGDLYAIVTGCSIEMVGDDVPAMAKEGREQDWPVIYANTPGFRGDVHQGYHLAVRALIEQLPDIWTEKETAPAGLVNIWGIIPNQDPFWRGNLQELGRLLEGIGLVPNLLLGSDQGVAAWKRVPGAILNIVVSPWGELPAELLEQRYGTPTVSVIGLPVGSAGGTLLRLVSEKLGLDTQSTNEFIDREESRLKRHFSLLADSYYRAGFQREFALVGESAQVVGIGEFLGKSFGLIPRTLVITDNPPEAVRDGLIRQLTAIQPGFETGIVFTEDRAEVADAIRTGKAGIVLGSNLEQNVARELGVPFLAVSFPLADRIVLDRGYAGYRGAAALLEDLGSVFLANYTVTGE